MQNDNIIHFLSNYKGPSSEGLVVKVKLSFDHLLKPL